MPTLQTAAPPTGTYVVEGKNARRVPAYYTGRAGWAFVSRDVSHAIVLHSRVAAQRTAERLNRTSALHGFTFRAELLVDVVPV